MRSVRLSDLRELLRGASFAAWWADCVALQLTAGSFTAFRRRSRDGFTLFLVNVARLLSSRLRETNQRLAGG